MFDDELEKIRLKKAEMLRKLQLIPKEIVKIHSIEYFNKILKDFPDKILIVDFWAVWCAPCKMIEPSVEDLAQAYKEKMKVVKLNVDENPKIPANYSVMSIPTLLLFKGGELKETIVGALPQKKIEEAITKHL